MQMRHSFFFFAFSMTVRRFHIRVDDDDTGGKISIFLGKTHYQVTNAISFSK